MVFPPGCYGVTCWWTACRVFPCHFAVSISRLIFVQVSPPSLDSKRGKVFARSGRKPFYSDLQCEFIQRVNSGNVLHPSYCL